MNPNNKETKQYDIGSRISLYRSKKNISTNKLANLAGISQSYLRDIELGNKNPTIEIVYIICQALEITLSQFFSDDFSDAINEDDLISQIYKLSSEQREKLLAFLKTL